MICTESGKLLNNQENDHYIITFSTYNSQKYKRQYTTTLLNQLLSHLSVKATSSIMTFIISTNQNLTLGFLSHNGYTKDTLGIIKMIEPFARDPVHSSYFLCLMMVNFLVGLFYRFLVFKQIWKTGGLFGRPINLLTGIFEMQILNRACTFFCCHFTNFIQPMH